MKVLGPVLQSNQAQNSAKIPCEVFGVDVKRRTLQETTQEISIVSGIG